MMLLLSPTLFVAFFAFFFDDKTDSALAFNFVAVGVFEVILAAFGVAAVVFVPLILALGGLRLLVGLVLFVALVLLVGLVLVALGVLGRAPAPLSLAFFLRPLLSALLFFGVFSSGS